MFWMCLSSCYLHMFLTLMILIYKSKNILGVIICGCRHNNLLFLPFKQPFNTVVRKRPTSIRESNTFFLDVYDFIHSLNIHRSNYIFEFSFRQLHPKYINKKKRKKEKIENKLLMKVIFQCTDQSLVAQLRNHHRS